MTDLQLELARRPRRWPWIALAIAGGLILAVAGGWRLLGTGLVYGLADPQGANLLRDQDVPAEAGAEELQADLRFLAEELPRRHVAFAEAFDTGAFRALVERLSAEGPGMTPEQRQMAVLQVLASGGTGTGHTMVAPFQRALDWRPYGITLYDFADGLHVVAAAARHGGLTGAKVVAVGGVDAAEALARLSPYVSADNLSSHRQRTPLLFGFAEPLMAVGLADADGRTTLTVGSGDGPREIVLEPFGVASLDGLGWAFRIRDGVVGAWSPADPRPRIQTYRAEEPAEGVVVLRVDSMDRDLGDLARQAVVQARSLADQGLLRRFVIDLRSNDGGNNELGRRIVDAVAGDPVVDRRGVLYVLIGGRTFSAAGNLATALERRTRATFAGETSGFAPTHLGDPAPMLLPGTKIVARVATRMWLDDLPGVRRVALEPELLVPLTARDHFGGNDPAIAAVLGHEVEVPEPRPGGGDLPAGLEGSWLATPLHRVTIRAARRSEGGEPAGSGDAAEPTGEVATDETSEAGEGQQARPGLEITTGEPYAATDLHPLGGGRWVTDIRGVELLAAADGSAPVLRWHGRDFPLRRVPADHRLPRELLGGRDADPEIEPDVEAAAAAYRAAAREVKIGSDAELAINRAGYRLLAGDRATDAVTLFRLANELFPSSANTWDSLGDGLRAIGDPAAARAAYLRALELDPSFDHSRDQLAELEREGG